MNDEVGGVVADGVTDASGRWAWDHDLSTDSEIVLVLTRDDGEELIRCRTLLRNLSQMECLMVVKKALTEDQIHRKFMDKHAELQKRGVAAPDPEMVARLAFS